MPYASRMSFDMMSRTSLDMMISRTSLDMMMYYMSLDMMSRINSTGHEFLYSTGYESYDHRKKYNHSVPIY